MGCGASAPVATAPPGGEPSPSAPAAAAVAAAPDAADNGMDIVAPLEALALPPTSALIVAAAVRMLANCHATLGDAHPSTLAAADSLKLMLQDAGGIEAEARLLLRELSAKRAALGALPKNAAPLPAAAKAQPQAPAAAAPEASGAAAEPAEKRARV
jgi:hypothetical protein